MAQEIFFYNAKIFLYYLHNFMYLYILLLLLYIIISTCNIGLDYDCFMVGDYQAFLMALLSLCILLMHTEFLIHKS